ncbi:MAG: HNH endonuclease [Chromatiales bacterium]|nr:HNH endonuclease [Chromatiales bacterium]
MRYWWVNQNQTYRHEQAGGYLWSPKKKANRARNPYYETMREVSPGDLVLCFQGTYIRAVGVAQSHCYECPKPLEFGTVGAYWDRVGWRVDVHYVPLRNAVRPKDHMGVLRPELPARYAPLLADGRGVQTIYLTEVPYTLMQAIAGLVGSELQDLMRMNRAAEPLKDLSAGVALWEEHLRREIDENPKLDDTEREQLILARRGQGRFKDNVRRIEHACRITGVDRVEHLRASHIKPWRDAADDERLAGENGLLLTPSIDHLFDRGFISFEDGGRLLISPVAHRESLARMGVPVDAPFHVGAFSEGQRTFLDFHRDAVFLERRGTGR